MNLFHWWWGYHIQVFSSISIFLELWQAFKVYHSHSSKIARSRPRFAKSRNSLHLQRFSFTCIPVIPSESGTGCKEGNESCFFCLFSYWVLRFFSKCPNYGKIGNTGKSGKTCKTDMTSITEKTSKTGKPGKTW